MNRSCSSGHVSDPNKRGNCGGRRAAFRLRAGVIAASAIILVLPINVDFVAAQTTALKWGQADAAGLSAWQVVAGETPELSADAKKYRFNPSRNLRQLNFDLDGDGRPEMFLSGTIDSFCGSAGCMTFVLQKDKANRWKIVCQTYAHYGAPLGDVRIGAANASGWRGFEASTQVNWIRQPDGDVACEETPLRRR